MKNSALIAIVLFLSASSTYAQTRVTQYDQNVLNVLGVNGTYIGFQAGNASTNNARHNTMVGVWSGQFNTDGVQNSFFGYRAGRANTTSWNSFFGSNAGLNTTIGASNSFFGQQTGLANISGASNAYFGMQAGQNSTGSFNSFFGMRAGRFNTGQRNSFFGRQSGHNNAGSNNLILGFQSGFNATGSSNIFIGYQAGFSETGSNKLYIENSNIANPLIWGDFATDQVQINGALEVTGGVTSGGVPINTDNQDLSLTGNTLSLTNDASTVDLAPYLDNTDNQDLNIAGNILSLTNDASTVDLAPYLDNTDNQDLDIAGNILSLTNDASTVDLTPYLDNTDNQDLDIAGNILSLTNDASTVDLTPYLDNTDSQDLDLTGDILSLTNDATAVDLAPYLDNTDNQDLANVLSSGNSAGNIRIVDVLDPANPQDVATMNYVDLAVLSSGVFNLEDNGSNVQNSISGTGFFQWEDIQIDGQNISSGTPQMVVRNNGSTNKFSFGSDNVSYDVLRPNLTNTHDLGASGFRWSNIYTSDLDITNSAFAGPGSAVAPSFSFTGDDNTGIFSPGPDRLGISAGGGSRLTIESSRIIPNVDIVPPANNIIDLGASAQRFEDGWIDDLNVETVNNLTFPTADGTSGQVLTTNGAGALTFQDTPGDNLGNHLATQNLAPNTDNAYTLGTPLANWNDVRTRRITSNGTNLVLDATGSEIWANNNFTPSSGGGANLGVSGRQWNNMFIQGNIQNSSGAVQISGLSYPTADGTSGQVLTTDGAGTLSFLDIPGVANIEDSGNDVQNSASGTGALQWENVRIDGNLIENPTGPLSIGGTSGAILLNNTVHLNAPSGVDAIITASLHPDPNANLVLSPKGTGYVQFGGTEIVSHRELRVHGQNADVDFLLRPKGSGTVQTSAAHTSNIADADDIITKGYADANYAGAGSTLTNLEDNGTDVQNSASGTGVLRWDNVEINGSKIDHTSPSNFIIDNTGGGQVRLESNPNVPIVADPGGIGKFLIGGGGLNVFSTPLVELGSTTGSGTANINVLSSAVDEDLVFNPKGAGTVQTSAAHTANISNADDIITKAYADANYSSTGLQNIADDTGNDLLIGDAAQFGDVALSMQSASPNASIALRPKGPGGEVQISPSVDTGTSNISEVFRLDHSTSGTPATNFGVGMFWSLNGTFSGLNSYYFTDATPSQQDTEYKWEGYSNAATTDFMSLSRSRLVLGDNSTPADLQTFHIDVQASTGRNLQIDHDGSIIMNNENGAQDVIFGLRSANAQVGELRYDQSTSSMNMRATNSTDDLLFWPGSSSGQIRYYTQSRSSGDIAMDGSLQDVDMNLVPKGMGTVTVPTGYEANIADDRDLINKKYFDDNINSAGLANLIDNGSSVQNSASGTGSFTWEGISLDGSNISSSGGGLTLISPFNMNFTGNSSFVFNGTNMQVGDPIGGGDFTINAVNSISPDVDIAIQTKGEGNLRFQNGTIQLPTSPSGTVTGMLRYGNGGSNMLQVYDGGWNNVGLSNLEDNGSNVENSSTGSGYFQWEGIRLFDNRVQVNSGFGAGADLVLQPANNSAYVQIGGDGDVVTQRQLKLGSIQADVDLLIEPKGTGTVKVPVGYDSNISSDQDLINKKYFDDNAGTGFNGSYTIDDPSTNTLIEIANFNRTTSGIPDVGIGGYITLGVENPNLGISPLRIGNEISTYSGNTRRYDFRIQMDYNNTGLEDAIFISNRTFSATFGWQNINVNGIRAINLGSENTADAAANFGVIIGHSSDVQAANAIAVGLNTLTSGQGGIAIGHGAESENTDAIAIGTDAGNALGTIGTSSVSIGSGTNSIGSDIGNNSIAIGTNAISSGAESISLGFASDATDNSSLAIGAIAQSTAQGGTAIGGSAITSAIDAVAVGTQATGAGNSSVALGKSAQANTTNSISIGNLSGTSTGTQGDNSVSIGNSVNDGTFPVGTSSVAIGDQTEARNTNTIAIGKSASARGAEVIALGQTAFGTGTSGIVIGRAASQSTGSYGIAFGDIARANGTGAMGFGRWSEGAANGAIMMGYHTSAQVNNIANSFELAWDGSSAFKVGNTIGTVITSNANPQVNLGDAVDGALAYNTTTGNLELRDGGVFAPVGAGGGITVGPENQIPVANTSGTDFDYEARFTYNGQSLVAEGTGVNSISIGTNASVDQTDGIVIGANSTITGDNTLVIGNNVSVAGSNNVMIGADQTYNSGNQSTVIGTGARQGNGASVVIGWDAGNTSGSVSAQHTSIGANSNSGTATIGLASTAIGSNTISSGNNSVALGSTAEANANETIAIGFDAGDNSTGTDGTGSITIGSQANSGTGNIGENSIAIGTSAQSNSTGGIAIGDNALTTNMGAVALGDGALSRGTNTIAIGNDAAATTGGGGNSQFVSIGNQSNSTNLQIGASSVAVGASTISVGGNSVAIGASAESHAADAIAIGNNAGDNGAGVDNSGSITLGANANSVSGQAIGQNSIAIGTLSEAVGIQTVNIGYQAGRNSTGTDGVASVTIGADANSTSGLNVGTNSVAIGAGSYTQGAGNVAIGVAAGANSTGASGSRSVSIGSDANSVLTQDIGASSVAIGFFAETPGAQAIAIGEAAGQNSTGADGASSISIGDDANSAAGTDIGTNSIALGSSTISSATSSIAIGDGAKAEDTNNISIGTNAGDASGSILNGAISIGDEANSSANNIGQFGVAVGTSAESRFNGSIAIGRGMKANADQAIIIGSDNITGNDSNDLAESFEVAFDGSTAFKVGNTLGTVITADIDPQGNLGDAVDGALAYNTSTGNLELRSGGTFAPVGTGASITVGPENQIPVANSAGTDFDYDTRFSYDGSRLIAEGTGTSSVAIGDGAQSAGASSVALGDGAATGATDAIAIGTNANASGSTTVAIGRNASGASNAGVVAIGNSAIVNGSAGIAIGQNSTGGANGIGIGNGAKAPGIGIISLGDATGDNGSGANGNRSVSIGNQVNSSNGVDIGANSVAIGNSADSEGANSVALGNSTSSSAASSVAIGDGAEGNATDVIAIGTDAGDNSTGADGINSISIGNAANSAPTQAIGAGSVAIGFAAQTPGQSGIAIGDAADTSVDYALALGADANTTGLGGMSFGRNSRASAQGAIMMGHHSAAQTNSVANSFEVAWDGSTGFKVGNTIGTVITANANPQTNLGDAVDGALAYNTSTGNLELRHGGSFAPIMGGGSGAQISGTPIANQIAVWTSPTQISGTTGMIFNGTLFNVSTSTTSSIVRATNSNVSGEAAIGTVNDSGDGINMVQEGSAATGTVFGLPRAGMSTITNNLAADAGIAFGTNSPHSVYIGAGNALALEINSSQTFDFQGNTLTNAAYPTASTDVATKQYVDDNLGGGLSFPLLAPDGTEGAPSYSFTNDTDMGMRRFGSDVLGLAVNGESTVRVGRFNTEFHGNANNDYTVLEHSTGQLYRNDNTQQTQIYGGALGATNGAFTSWTGDANNNSSILNYISSDNTLGNFELYSQISNLLYRIDASGSHFLVERSAKAPDVAGYGQLWVRDDSPNTLIFTDDAGNDHDLTALGGGSGANIAGTPVNNELAVWTNSTTIEGESNLQWDGTEFVVGDDLSEGIISRIEATSVELNFREGGSLVGSIDAAVPSGGTNAGLTFRGNSLSTTQPAVNLFGSVASGQDTGTEPAVKIVGSINTGSSLVNRNVLGLYNGSTLVADVNNFGDWDYQGNDIGGLGEVELTTGGNFRTTIRGSSNAVTYLYSGNSNVNRTKDDLIQTSDLAADNAAGSPAPVWHTRLYTTNPSTPFVNRPIMWQMDNGGNPLFQVDLNGDWNYQGNALTNVAYPVNSTDVATKQYVDDNSGGSGDVSKVGTPVNDQVAVWTGDGTVEGDPNLTYTGGILRVSSVSLGTQTVETIGTAMTLSGGTGLNIVSGNGTIVMGDNLRPNGNFAFDNGTLTNSWDDTYSQRFLADDGLSGSTPAFSFGDDPNTGIYNQSTDRLGFAVGGNTTMSLGFAEGLIVTTSSQFFDEVDLNGQNLLEVSSMYIDEKVSADTDIAGKGQLWVRNDIPNTLMFTDDSGVDHDLLNGGGGNSWSLTGNSGTADGTNFIGTTDNVPLSFRVANQKAGRIENTSSTANTFFGYLSGNVITSGFNNTGVGYFALSANTTGSYNVAVGRGAMTSNTIGHFNVANGYNALNANIDGTRNTANGNQALQANTSGTSNTASGNWALINNTTGDNNTAVGNLALIDNTTGSNNTALGYNTDVSAANLTNATAIGSEAVVTASNTIQLGNSSVSQVFAGTGSNATVIAGGLQITGGTPGVGKVLTSNASGVATWQDIAANNAWSSIGNSGTVDGTNFIGTTDNVPFSIRVNNQRAGRIESSASSANSFYGYQAGNALTTGVRNTAIGYQTLATNTGGSSNTAIGYHALNDNTTGGLNTAIGVFALNSSSTGSNNTATGYNALEANTIGSSNTAHGLQALWKNTTGGSNTAMGSSALNNNISGLGNTAVGAGTLSVNTTGSSITAIGQLANVSANNLINATAIGNAAVVNASNKVVIGNTSVNVIGGYANWSNLSDGRFKSNVQEDVPGLSFINKLRPVTYKLKMQQLDEHIMQNMSEETKNERMQMRQTSDNDIPNKVSTGFVAQEVEKIAKDIGYDFDAVIAPQNETDHYSLSYAQFVVPLTKAVQELSGMLEEQKATIQQLQNELADLKSNDASNVISPRNPNDLSTLVDKIELLQNKPNPFSMETRIEMSLPQSVSTAEVIIYDLRGTQLKSIPVEARGATYVSIQGRELEEGMYLYALIADGEVIGTKRMILTK